jgi:hypothetical protein
VKFPGPTRPYLKSIFRIARDLITLKHTYDSILAPTKHVK